MNRHQSNRREFLKGRAAVEAARELGDSLGPGMAEPAAVSASQNERVAAHYLMQIRRRAMATDFEVVLNASQYPSGPEAAMAALDLVQELEDQLTVYRGESEVLDINRRAADGAVPVEPRLFALLQEAQSLYRLTAGAFDITAGPLSKVWGFFRRQGSLPSAEDVRAALACIGGQSVVLDETARTVRFLQRGTEINLNAIGKGYALDRCAERLLEAGVHDFLIHGGQSSVIAHGTRTRLGSDAAGWQVALRHPLRPGERLGEIWLRDRALGTSGAANQFFYHQGRRFGHVLDPRTGWPAEGVLSATVLAPTAALADALSTAFFVIGPEAAAAYCESRAELSAILVCPGPRVGGLAIHAIGLGEGEWLVREPYASSQRGGEPINPTATG